MIHSYEENELIFNFILDICSGKNYSFHYVRKDMLLNPIKKNPDKKSLINYLDKIIFPIIPCSA